MKQQPERPESSNKPKTRLEVDEVHVQIIIREIDANGETIAKHPAQPLQFVNERSFREWAAKPFNFDDQRKTDTDI